MRLNNKRALVTAAGQGIGRAIAEALAAEGAEVFAFDVNGAALADLKTGQGLVGDATDAAAVAALPERTGRIDVLENAAGFVHAGTILDCDEADWQRSVNLNMTAMYRLCRAFLPGMIAAGGGSIVNVASVASSIKGVPNRFAYGATKAGPLA